MIPSLPAKSSGRRICVCKVRTSSNRRANGVTHRQSNAACFADGDAVFLDGSLLVNQGEST
jgi:hypothetical protein